LTFAARTIIPKALKYTTDRFKIRFTGTWCSALGAGFKKQSLWDLCSFTLKILRNSFETVSKRIAIHVHKGVMGS